MDILTITTFAYGHFKDMLISGTQICHANRFSLFWRCILNSSLYEMSVSHDYDFVIMILWFLTWTENIFPQKQLKFNFQKLFPVRQKWFDTHANLTLILNIFAVLYPPGIQQCLVPYLSAGFPNHISRQAHGCPPQITSRIISYWLMQMRSSWLSNPTCSLFSINYWSYFAAQSQPSPIRCWLVCRLGPPNYRSACRNH